MLTERVPDCTLLQLPPKLCKYLTVSVKEINTSTSPVSVFLIQPFYKFYLVLLF